MELIDALRELLHREWGDTKETEFILNAVEAFEYIYEKITCYGNKVVAMAEMLRTLGCEWGELGDDDSVRIPKGLEWAKSLKVQIDKQREEIESLKKEVEFLRTGDWNKLLKEKEGLK